ncbi:MAG: Ger(x)C family spore germination protein [Firmicutes bacterium]|nr:Ger(x)C family spore germination protein [Bacillota bacterium]
MKSRFAAVVSAVAACALLQGCSGKINLEQRGFAVGLGIDKYAGEKSGDNNFTVTLALPVYGESSGGDAIEKSKMLKTADSGTVAGALRAADFKSSQKIFLGQTRLLALGRDLLADRELFRQAIGAAERNDEISKRMYVMATKGSAADIIGAESESEPMAGFYVPAYYSKEHRAVGMTFKTDLESLVSDLRAGGNALLPEIEASGTEKAKEFEINGSAVIRDYALAGFLSGVETRGFEWVKGDCRGEVVSIDFDGECVPVRVEKSSAKVTFGEDGKLNCRAAVAVCGTVAERKFGDSSSSDSGKTARLEAEFAAAVRREILATADILQREMGADAYQFLNELHKNERELYAKYAPNWGEAFREMGFEAEVKAVISGSGAID